MLHHLNFNFSFIVGNLPPASNNKNVSMLVPKMGDCDRRIWPHVQSFDRIVCYNLPFHVLLNF